MSLFARSTMVEAKLQNLAALRGFLETFCAQAQVSEDYCLRLNLVLEELFTNTVQHGHGGDSDAPVWVSVATGGSQPLRLAYEDTAPPFNPYARLPTKSPDTTLQMRKLGGLGVLLTRELSATRDYAYLNGRNCIRLSLRSPK